MEMPQLQLLDEQDRIHTQERGSSVELPDFIFSEFTEEPLHTGLIPDQENNDCSIHLENTHQNANSVTNPSVYTQEDVKEGGSKSVPCGLQESEGANYEFDCSLIVPPLFAGGTDDSAALVVTPVESKDERTSTSLTETAPVEHTVNGVQDDILDLQPQMEPYNHLHGQTPFPVHDTRFHDIVNHHISTAQSDVGFEPGQAFQGVRNDFFAGLDVTGMMRDGIVPPGSAEIPSNNVEQTSGGNSNYVYDNKRVPPFSSVSPEKDFSSFDEVTASQLNGLQTGDDGEVNGNNELSPSGIGNENEAGLTADVLGGVNFGDFVGNPAIVPPLPADFLLDQSIGRKRRAAPSSPKRVAKKSRTKVQDLDPALVHVCTVEGCNRKFAKKYNLKIHLRRHNGDLPFMCEYSGCSKRFMWLSSFSRHQRVHEAKQHKKRKFQELGGGDDDDVVGEEDGATLLRIGGVVNRVEHSCRESVVLASCLKAMEGSPPKQLLEVWRQKPVVTNEWRVKQVKAYQERGYNMENEGVIRVCEALRRKRKRRLATTEQAGRAEL